MNGRLPETMHRTSEQRLGTKIVISIGSLRMFLIRDAEVTGWYFRKSGNHCANMHIFLGHSIRHPNQFHLVLEKHITPTGYTALNTPD